MARTEQSEFDAYTSKLVRTAEDKHDAAKRKEVDAIYKKRHKKRKALQRDCAHPQTYTDYWEDYHKREDHTEVYCKVCGKLLEER